MVTEIIDNLYVGGISEVENIEDTGDWHFIDVRGMIDRSYTEQTNYTMALKIAKEIDKWIGQKKVIVYCGGGLERSPLAVIMYLHIYKNYTFQNALKLVQDKRKVGCLTVMDRLYWIGV